MTARPPIIAVCGASQADAGALRDAEEVGRRLAARGALVVCGGLGGVMAAVARGVRAGDGTCVGLLPGNDPDEAGADISVAIPTGLGEMRNALIARCCRAMIAIGGGYGTLSELALALRLGRPVAALHTWEIVDPGGEHADPNLRVVESAAQAVDWVMERA